MYLSAQERAVAAYQQMGAVTLTMQPTPQQMMLALFDALRTQLLRAQAALGRGDLALKGQALGKAVRILEEGIRSGLDRSKDPVQVESLDQLYRYCVARLTEANLKREEAPISEVMNLIEPLHEAWRQVARQPLQPQLG